ncbi:class I SAM-dependent methyltransferase [Patulibacter sp. SYSU D01012]|uniref:class I SAM-dependent methyltransferase n=1 Tax=Patulibacter sp. SYSU D01012 TaxID=2817381 RepID=UPI0032C17FB4
MHEPEDPGARRLSRFWEARAREDALRYSLPSGARVDEPAFAASGGAALDAFGEHLGAWLPDDLDDAVLDVGCGAGRLTGALAERGRAVTAVDVAPTMVATARARLGDDAARTWHVARAADLPLDDATVGAALLLGVLPHLPTLELVTDALAELARVLRPEGTAVFDVRSAPAPLTLPGEDGLPSHVARHPLWRGSVVGLETLAAVAFEHGLGIERIAGSETARSLVLARREAV